MRAALLCLLFVVAACSEGNGLPPVPDKGKKPNPDWPPWPDLNAGKTDGPGKFVDRGVDRPRPDQGKPKPDLGKPDAPSLCAAGESLFGGHCYRVTGIKYISYTVAKTMCANQVPSSKMVAISSLAENQFVYGLLPTLNYVSWIGLKRTATGFAWETGEPFTYSYWAAGEPNNETGNEDCGVMWGPNLANVSFRAHWNDMPCNYANVDAVICERVP